MPSIICMTNPITLELIHNGVAVREEDDGFGGMAPVYNIEQVHTVNDSGKDFHLVINSGPTAAYQDQVHSGREVLVTLPVEDQFETSQLGYSLSSIR